jgi:hypothetical protein
MVGGSDFSLIGRPILSSELVSVHAMVIEKALSHIKTVFKKKKRKQFQRINCKCSTAKHFVFANKTLLLQMELPGIQVTATTICGVVVRVPGYRSRGFGFNSGRYQIF